MSQLPVFHPFRHVSRHAFTRLSLLMLAVLLLATACSQPPAATATPAVDDTAADTSEAATETVAEADGDDSALAATATPAADVTTVNDAPATSLPLIDDFEPFAAGDLPQAQAGAVTLGFLTWSDGSPVNITPVVLPAADERARPEQEGENVVLQLETAMGQAGWAGFTHAFSAAGMSAWTPQDWSPYEGFSLWLYGNNSGGVIFIDILENRNPDSSADDAERWSTDIPDDFSGWQKFEIPFSEFNRKDIGNEAPFDGLSLTEVHGYAIGTFGEVPMGPQTFYVDDVQLYGVAPPRPVEAAFSEARHIVSEVGRSEIYVHLNKPAETTVTVDYGVAFGYADAADYEAVSGTLTFPPGERVASFTFHPVDDDLDEANETLMIALSNPSGAELGFLSRATVVIRDNDDPIPGLLLDFEVPEPLVYSDPAAFSIMEVAPDAELALPAQASPAHVAQLSGGDEPVAVGQRFVAAQDWSGHETLSFWFYGENSGNAYTVQLLEDPALTTAEVPPADWELIWSDEFTGPAGAGPNPGIWRPEQGDGTLNGIPGWGNNELETYTGDPENAALDGEGNLVITARETGLEDQFLRCYYGPCEYTSARLITWHTFEQAYGRIEARLQIPYGQGLWPAFWMLGNDLNEVSWPASGEIDIMENIGREPDTVHGTVHGPGYSGGNAIGGSYTLPEGAFADDFHVFAIEWTPEGINWFVDDVLYNTVTPDDVPAGGEWVYDHPFFIIMNVAVGGSWPGVPDETTVFPQTMTVDYVRVYGAPDSAERYEATFVDDFNGWQRIELPLADFTPAADQPAAAAPDGLSLTQVVGFDLWLPAGAGTVYLDQVLLTE